MGYFSGSGSSTRKCPEIPFLPSTYEGTDQTDLSPPHPLARKWRCRFYPLPLEQEPCPGFAFRQWVRVACAAFDFLAQDADTAAVMGWTTVDLFGVHPTVGVARVDCCGALMVSNGSRIVAIAPDTITYANGLKYHRVDLGSPLCARVGLRNRNE